MLAFASSLASATVVQPRGLHELVAEAQYVGVVWIEQSISLSPDATFKYPVCGAAYKARTVDVVKGKPGIVSFYATEGLVVGREYLVLLANGLRPTTDIISTTTLAGISPPGRSKYMEDCTKRYPGLWSMLGAASPLLDRRQKIVIAEKADDRWVAPQFYLSQAEAIGKFEPEGREFIWTMGPTPYPSGTYFSWRDLRGVLLNAAAAQRPNGK